jgi:anti-anti-sigma regulatory factor
MMMSFRSDRLDDELRRAEASDADRILVDLTRLKFIDSSDSADVRYTETR